MDVDHKRRLFHFQDYETRFLKFPVDFVSPVSFEQADVLMGLAVGALNRVSGLDPSRVERGARRAELEAKQREGIQKAGRIIEQISPYVRSQLADEVQQFLNDESTA